MSLYTYTSSIFSLSPKCWVENGILYARTNLFVQSLLLFGAYRKVIVHRRRRAVVIKGRILWIIPYKKIVKFDDIDRISYTFFSIPTSWSIFIGKMDEIETYRVSLVIFPNIEIKLFKFAGEGSILTGWKGVMVGDDSIFDEKGTQEIDSRNYMKLLQQFTGKDLS